MGRRRPGSKVEPARGIELGGRFIEPGTSDRLEIPVARLPTGTWLSLPVAVVSGASGGPTIWLSAAVHGDELVGVAVIRSLMRRLAAQDLAGTVLLVPVVNVFGLINESRYLPDGRDLNRSFPGSKRGSLASQLASLFLDEIVTKCSFGIDFHTGSGGRTNLPQIRANLDDPESRRLAEQFGPPVTLHSVARDGSLRAAATERGIRCLVYEAGEAGRIDREQIRVGVEGTLRVLRALEMIRSESLPGPKPSFIARESTWVRARRSGFCQLRVGLGDLVGEGQALATISDLLGEGEAVLKAPEDGVVIGLSTKPLVNRGDAIVHLGEPEPT